MVKITYDPWKEIVIKEYAYFKNISDLAEIVAGLRSQGVPAALYWANDVVFFFTEVLPDTVPIAEDFKLGTIYWANVSFAMMAQYKPALKTRENIQVPVINQSSNSTMKEITDWLKKQPSK